MKQDDHDPWLQVLTIWLTGFALGPVILFVLFVIWHLVRHP